MRLLLAAVLLCVACASQPLPMPAPDGRLASFEQDGMSALAVSVTGKGSVMVSAAQEVCVHTSCFFPLKDGSTVKIEAVADPRFHFVKWEGACHGTEAQCELTLRGPEIAVAHFERNANDAERTAKEGAVAANP